MASSFAARSAHAPGASALRPAPRSPSGRRRARVALAIVAKGQKGVRRVAQAPGQEQFPPGSVMGKMMNLRLNTINWKVLAEASEKLEGELASQPILGLVRAEVTLRGVAALERERRGYREYILLRSLGLKAWFTMATSRAGVKDPRMRCAVGAALAKPDGEFNIYRRVLAHCREVADDEDWNAFADGLAGDVRRVAETVAEADLKTTKVRYDAKVTEEDFDRIEAEVNGAIEALEAIKNEGGVKGGEEEEARAIAVTVPWVDPGAPPAGVLPSSEAGGSEEKASSSDEGASSSEEGASSEDASAAESMFGKRSKKKKAKMPKAGGGVVAGASALASALRSGESLEATLARLAKRQAEPTFPDVARWTVGDAKQATASEAVAALAAVALGAPEGSTVVAPSAIFASALAFDLETFGRGRTVVSPERAAAEEGSSEGSSSGGSPVYEAGSLAVFLAFDPAADPEGDAARMKKGMANARAAGAIPASVTVRLGPRA